VNVVLTPKQLTDEGQAAYRRGEYLAAGRAYEAAAQGYVQMGDVLKAAEQKNNSSVAYLKAGDAAAALRVVEGTPDVFSVTNDVRRQGMALGNYGAALEGLGRLKDALQAYRQSADLLENAGDDDLYAYVMQALSAMQLRTGHPLEALGTMQVGVEGIKNPTPRQQLVKKLLRLPFRFLGQ
jgi:tetratricopeptide (TPR) repeat protein